MKVKVAGLSGVALDYAVATCEGFVPISDGISWIIEGNGIYKQLPKYSTEWGHGGPIIEREGIGFMSVGSGYWACYSRGRTAGRRVNGETQLIAAMRCYVVSKLGDEIEVPNKIMNKAYQALLHVRSIHPKVTQVFFSSGGGWFFCDDVFEGVTFTGAEDIGLLEEAVDSLSTSPCAFSIHNINTEQRLSLIYLAIDEGNFEKARGLAEQLRSEIGDFPDLQEALALLDRFSLLVGE